MEQLALCDVVLTQIKVSGGTTHNFSTAEEIGSEAVIEEGEQKSLKIKGQLIASKQTPDVVLGYDLTCKDNLFTPDLLVALQGGTVTKSTNKFSKYVAPAVGALPRTAAFDFITYIEIVGDDGPTGEYLKYMFPNCRGTFVSPNFKDGEYYASEYKIKSRPALGTALYTVDLVTSLPEGVQAFEHPAIKIQKEQENQNKVEE